MMKYCSFIVILITLLGSCSADEKAEMEQQAGYRLLSDSAVSLQDAGFPLELQLPALLLQNEELTIYYNTSFGQVELELGNEFKISIAEDNLTLEQIKKDLNQDQLFTYKFFDCGQDQLYYQGILPTGESYYFHYIRSVEIDKVKYLIRTDPLGEFTKEDIDRIIKSVNTLRKGRKENT